jgi:hypothetical protein
MEAFAIVLDTATPRFRAIAGRLQGSGQGDKFLMRWGARVRKVAIERAVAKGGRKLWRQIARSINLQQSGGSVTVGASHVAAAQKQFGGVIRAKGKAAGGADALTIPIAPEAEGQSAAKFALSGKQLFALGMEDGSGVLGYTEDNTFHPLFALVRQTRPIPADPFFPSDEESLEMGEEEGLRLIAE